MDKEKLVQNQKKSYRFKVKKEENLWSGIFGGIVSYYLYVIWCNTQNLDIIEILIRLFN